MKLAVPISLLLATLLSCRGTTSQTGQVPIDSLIGDSWEISESATGDGENTECKVSRRTAFEQVAGPVGFSDSATYDLEEPRLSALPQLFGFSRDASYGFFGQGNLRVEFYMILDDGTVIQDLDYVDESIITSCVDHVTGLWKSKILADGSRWPPPKTNSKSPSATAELAPKLYMSHLIAGGQAVAEHSVGSKKLSFEGRGAHSRIWAKDSWFKICDGWNAIRAFQPVSRIQKGVAYYSALLFKDGELLVGTSGIRSNVITGTGKPNDNAGGDKDADYATLTHDFGVQVTGNLADRSTGHYIKFVSPRLGGKEWRFLAEHKRKKFDMSMGGGLGLSGFTTRVTGGEVGGDEAAMDGFGWSEQVALPMKIKEWQIWIIYGVGFLGELKHTLFDVFQKLLRSN
ncbi:hypothetical protein F4801DRAFT_584760 [Xylaria longipes]|nr:hypothetical protein F4801DRAFT_584760 [Xylaria longipes]